MRSISTYIEYLLMTQHYAFLPGLGGFVLADHEAAIQSGMIVAPGRSVQFNRFMTHDDGQLANVIMEDTGISYSDAVKRIQYEVNQILNKARNNGKYKLGCLGAFVADSENIITFRPADAQRIDPLYYGRESFAVKTWKEIEEERAIAKNPRIRIEKERKNDVIVLPKYWLHRAAVVALVVCFFFGNFFTGNRSTNYQASMFNADCIIANFSTLDAQSWDENWESEEYASDETTAELAETPSDITTNTPEVAPVQEIATAPAVTTPVSGKLYYIIIASTTSQEEAQRTLRRFARKGYEDVGIIERDGRLRLYLDSFPVKADAENALYELRKNEMFEQAWLLPVKCTQSSSVLSLDEWTPLQLIIKEKDNDHFTMELSHLNQPAERDQG